MRPWTVWTVRAVVTCLPDVDRQGWLLPRMPAYRIGARVVEHNPHTEACSVFPLPLPLSIQVPCFGSNSTSSFPASVSDGNSVIKPQENLRFAAVATKNKPPMESRPRRPVTVSFREAVLRVSSMLCETWLVQHPRNQCREPSGSHLSGPGPGDWPAPENFCMFSVPQTLDRPTPASTSIRHASGTTGEG
jgi:hypothetical protein